MTPQTRRAARLSDGLHQVSTAFIAVVCSLDEAAWQRVPAPGVWSAGKDAEHVAEAMAYHMWIVRLTIGEKVPSRRPVLERSHLTSKLERAEVVALIRRRTDDGKRLVAGLSEEQLDLVTRPPRARGQRLAETIDRVLIGHVATHAAEIQAKARSSAGIAR